MIVVSDTSPITNLLRIGRINILRDLFETVIIPDAVFREINVLEHQRTEILKYDWIRVASLTNHDLFDELIEKVDPGEAEAISLSVELSATLLLIDESAGRSEAERIGLEVTGLIGVLIRAKDKGLIKRVGPELIKLVDEAGFWISDGLIRNVLNQIGED